MMKLKLSFVEPIRAATFLLYHTTLVKYSSPYFQQLELKSVYIYMDHRARFFSVHLIILNMKNTYIFSQKKY